MANASYPQSIAQRSTAGAVNEKVDVLIDQNKKLSEQVTTLREEMVSIKEKAAVAQYPAGVNPYVVGGITGRIPGDSEGYSILKAARLAKGRLKPEDAKYEWDIHQKMVKLYRAGGWQQDFDSVLVPYGTRYIPAFDSESERWNFELKHKMSGQEVDPNEVEWIKKRLGIRTKDFGTISDAAGGVLVGFPTLMEVVDIQRNVEVFAQAGGTEQGLPANGRMQYPKLTSPSSAFWVGESVAITESTPGTGYLDLVGKKLGILIDLNNELLRFASPATEAMVRTDMAKVGALKADLAMLEGTGGTQIKGLITYTPTSATWTTGTDPLLTFSVQSNKIQISDAADMEAVLPDTAGTPTAWVMRRQLWAKIRNRRADSVATTDQAGPYLVNLIRQFGDQRPLEWDGTKVVRSSQVSATRGAGANQTYVILGNFNDWITARFGMMEFLASNTSDQALQNDQTRLRSIMTIDAGPRHASSFVFADLINIG